MSLSSVKCVQGRPQHRHRLSCPLCSNQEIPTSSAELEAREVPDRQHLLGSHGHIQKLLQYRKQKSICGGPFSNPGPKLRGGRSSPFGLFSEESPVLHTHHVLLNRVPKQGCSWCASYKTHLGGYVSKILLVASEEENPKGEGTQHLEFPHVVTAGGLGSEVVATILT